jgi:hypothetical protein
MLWNLSDDKTQDVLGTYTSFNKAKAAFRTRFPSAKASWTKVNYGIYRAQTRSRTYLIHQIQDPTLFA